MWTWRRVKAHVSSTIWSRNAAQDAHCTADKGGRVVEWRQDGIGAGVAYSLSTTSGGVVARWGRSVSGLLPLGAKGAAHAQVACR
jgi:hypothetical protein